MSEQNNLDNLRHSASHLLAAAVLELYPGAKPTLGPPIEDGFYYDFDNLKISENDLPRIEEKMRDVVKSWKGFKKIEKSPDEAKKQFAGNQYKAELIDEHSGKGEKITLFKSGDFIDLCRGGHIENPSKQLKHFKLLSVAGAYWRGDEKNPMLTRIYGTAFPTEKELKDYLTMRSEAEKRDHKKLGKQLDLFLFSDLVGAGLPLWTAKGTMIRHLLDDFVWQLRKEKGYSRVEIPHITKKELYIKSGHWDKFSNELFHIKTREGHEFVMKPMNCPHHIQIYDSRPRSYKELPQRYANTTMVYRDEQTGELSGLARVRSITQDDAHVFCRYSQIKDEMLAIWDIVDKFYKPFGFDLKVRLSLHDKDNFQNYIGSYEDWEKSEDVLRDIAKDKKVDSYEAPGEAAFYGPKIDFMAKDSLGREWQVATIQLDMNMPDRFNLSCINEKGESERITMIHAAIMGAIERFMAIIIEHFAGAFPVWLSPVQVKVLPITDRNLKYSQELVQKLQMEDVRVELDDRSETLSSKIRDAQNEKVPYMLVVGDKEEKDNKVAVRLRTEKDLGQMGLDKFIELIHENIDKKSLTL
jgi:threonyl-tRNA synthetase